MQALEVSPSANAPLHIKQLHVKKPGEACNHLSRAKVCRAWAACVCHAYHDSDPFTKQNELSSRAGRLSRMTGYYPHEVGIGTSRYNTLAVFVLRDCQVIAFGRSIRKHDQSGAFLSVFSGASGIPPRHNQQRSRVLLGGVKLEDIFHAEQEMCRMGSAASTAVYYAQRERKTRALLLHYADAK